MKQRLILAWFWALLGTGLSSVSTADDIPSRFFVEVRAEYRGSSGTVVPLDPLSFSILSLDQTPVSNNSWTEYSPSGPIWRYSIRDRSLWDALISMDIDQNRIQVPGVDDQIVAIPDANSDLPAFLHQLIERNGSRFVAAVPIVVRDSADLNMFRTTMERLEDDDPIANYIEMVQQVSNIYGIDIIQSVRPDSAELAVEWTARVVGLCIYHRLPCNHIVFDAATNFARQLSLNHGSEVASSIEDEVRRTLLFYLSDASLGGYHISTGRGQGSIIGSHASDDLHENLGNGQTWIHFIRQLHLIGRNTFADDYRFYRGEVIALFRSGLYEETFSLIDASFLRATSLDQRELIDIAWQIAYLTIIHPEGPYVPQDWHSDLVEFLQEEGRSLAPAGALRAIVEVTT